MTGNILTADPRSRLAVDLALLTSGLGLRGEVLEVALAAVRDRAAWSVALVKCADCLARAAA